MRKNVFLTSKTTKRTRQEAEQELATSLKMLQTDHLDIWQMHDVRTPEEIKTILGPGGAMEAFQAAKKAGKCRFIGFTGHFYPETHAALLQAYDQWDSVLLPVHAADHAYLSFEKTALPVAVSQGIGVQAIKVFCKAFLLRSLSPRECLEYTLSMPVHVAVCGAGTRARWKTIRVAQSFKPLSAEAWPTFASARSSAGSLHRVRRWSIGRSRRERRSRSPVAPDSRIDRRKRLSHQG